MRFLKVTVLLIFTVNLSYGQSDIQTLLAVASANLKNEKYDVALNMVKEVLVYEPENTHALQMEINIYMLQDDLKSAASAAEEAIEKLPGDPEFIYLYGLINLERGRDQKAVNEFDKIIEQNSYSGMYKVYLNRGVAYTNLQEYELALADYRKSIELEPGNAAAYHSRGMLNYQLRDYSAAVSDFRQALLFNSDNPETQFNLGMSYFKMDEKENACPHFHQACKNGNLNACKMVLMECSNE